MNIQSINFNTKNQNFKSTYPVVHWVAETNGSYAPVVTMELTKKLQRILVGVLNRSKKNNQGQVGTSAIDYISKCDLDYRRIPVVRTFYDRKGGFDKKIIPFAHLITGYDAKDFDNCYGKAIGEAKANAPRKYGKPESAELKQAVMDYSLGGQRFVNNKNKKLYDNNGLEYGLHTKFQTIRSKTGRIKGYKLVDVKFCPETGPKNPFVRTGLIKMED